MRNTEVKTELNRGILDAITPSEITFERNRLAIGEKLMKAYGVIQYAPKVPVGWLNRITGLANAMTVITYIPNNSGELLQAISKNILYQKGKAQSTRDYVQQQRSETGVENGENLIRRIDQQGESVGYFSLVILAIGETENELKLSCKSVEARLTGLNFKARGLASLQIEAYRTASPYHVPGEKILNCTQTIMPMSTMQYGLPCTTANFSDRAGGYFGRDINNGLICLDTWMRGGDRTNSNWVILGDPGQGKSQTAKHIITTEYMFGTKIYLLDPEKEYRELTHFLGGEVINIGGAENGKINPLQIKEIGQADDEEENRGLSDLAVHLKNAETFFELYLPDMDGVKRAILKDVILEVYREKGITFETDAATLKNEDYPVIGDIYRLLLEKKKTEQDDYATLAALLKDIAVGGDQFLWNGQTTIHTKSRVVCLDTHTLQDVPDRIKKTQYFNALTWMWEQASRNRNERCLIVCDEAYLMVDQNVPQALIKLRNFAKRGRKYNIGIMIVSHSVVDFLAERVKQYGQELLGNTCYKVFFGCDGKSLQELADLYNLKDAEKEFLLRKQRGIGLVTIGSKRMRVKFDLGYKMQFLTGGGR